jgi:DNA-binding response OmpR family regulator
MDRILVIDDDVELCQLVGEYLRAEGFTIECVHDGESGLKKATNGEYLLVVLDVMLPGINGFEVLRRIRATSRLPVLLLTARGEDVDRIVGLEIGADDYLTKPFGVRELMARARALMRRPRATADPAASGKPAVVRDLEVDPARRRATVGGREVELTSHEFDLLYLLASHPGVVFSREALLARIWKGDTFVTDRSVDALVKRVRKKIEPDQSAPTYVLTVWGTGYKCVDE